MSQPHSAARFPTTHWSRIARAGGAADDEARAWLECSAAITGSRSMPSCADGRIEGGPRKSPGSNAIEERGWASSYWGAPASHGTPIGTRTATRHNCAVGQARPTPRQSSTSPICAA